MRVSVQFLLALGITIVPGVARGHFLWATLDPATKTVAVGLRETPTDEALPLGERAELVKAWTHGGAPVALTSTGDLLTGSAEDHVVGVSLDYGVLDRREGGRGLFWLRYYAKAADSMEATQTPVGLPIDATLAMRDGKPVLTVLKDGKPAPGAEVVVAGDEEFSGKTGSDGTLALPARSGPIAVRAMVADRAKGEHGGKAYDLVRSYISLTVAGPQPEASVPLTKRISQAFGDRHDVVGETAFIDTLMGGRLTKPQWIDHLQQRAIVHEELDRILRAAAIPAYGDDQHGVVVLLRDDLTALGAKWPDAGMAWPMTNDFLKTLRESEAKGPYFALGVWHVYYGGITHGGRQIGAVAAKAVNREPAYYLKSGGYRSYAARINEISDPEAQRQMIEGGLAAYRYIIGINDSPSFRAN